MGTINFLDEGTINKIAAGEVIDRPSSIIKELVENSIDAKASAIAIEIKNGGLSYIRVTDNGEGMSSGDAKVSLIRHATSKIREADDIERISTLGFRGEALASIVAVTQMEIITRPKDSISGYQIINEGGNITSEGEIGCPEGTTIIARNLFYNTPARLKFVKSSRAESAHISEMAAKLILANPEISFKYINNEKVVYYSPGDGDLKNAAFSIYGADIVRQSISINTDEDATSLNAWGLLGLPSLQRGNRNHQSFFVNGRYVKSDVLVRALETAYKPYLTVNKFPWAIIHIEIDPSMIDVNVHPAKTEIRFNDSNKVENFLVNHIRQILMDNPYIPTIGGTKLGDAATYKPSDNDDSPIIAEQLEISPKEGLSHKNYKAVNKNSYYPIPSKHKIGDNTIKSSNIPNPHSFDNSMYDRQLDNNIARGLSSVRIVGRLFSTYIILEDDIQCFLIDQHAAHERLLFERYKKMVSKGEVLSQQLLPPVVIEVTHREQLAITDSIELFHDLGFDIEEFGGRSFTIRGVPIILGTSDVKGFFYGLLDEIGKQNNSPSLGLKMEDIILMSCRDAVMAGDRLSDMEIKALLRDILAEEIPMTCPHGRPIMVAISRTELEKSFKRIQ